MARFYSHETVVVAVVEVRGAVGDGAVNATEARIAHALGVPIYNLSVSGGGGGARWKKEVVVNDN